MTRRLFEAQERSLRVVLRRVGESADIKRASGTSPNKYGKVSDTDQNFSVTDTERCYRMYGEMNNRPNENAATGGRVDVDAPLIVFHKGTVAQEGDRVEFPDGNIYALDEEIPRQTHTEFRSTLIT